MQIVLDESSEAGKVEVIKRCASEGGYVVCAGITEVYEIATLAEKIKQNIPYPLSFKEFINKRMHPRGVTKFHFIDMGLILQRFTLAEISTISLHTEAFATKE